MKNIYKEISEENLENIEYKLKAEEYADINEFEKDFETLKYFLRLVSNKKKKINII